MMLPISALSTTCAPTARMMTHAPALSILFPIRVTLTERYWVTSDERRSFRKEIFVLNRYFIRPTTVDRSRGEGSQLRQS